jgi:hypothetical protein
MQTGTFFGTSGAYGFYSIARDIYGEEDQNSREATEGSGRAKPTSTVAGGLSPAFSPNFLVRWYGSDPYTGIMDYTIYVLDNDGPFTARLTEGSSACSGLLGHLSLFSIARNFGASRKDEILGRATTQVPRPANDVTATSDQLPMSPSSKPPSARRPDKSVSTRGPM